MGHHNVVATCQLFFRNNCYRMYPPDTKYKAIVHYNHFWKSLRGVAKIYNVSKSTLQRWIGQRSCSKKSTRKKSLLKNDIVDFIGQTLTHNPFMGMLDLSKMIASKFGLQRSAKTISRHIKRMGWTRKKAFRMVDYTHKPDDVLAFGESYKQASDHNVIVSIDECGFYVGDHNRYGYSKRGEKLKVRGEKQLRRTKFTVIMAVTKDGIHHFEIQETNCKKADFVRFINSMPSINNGVLLMDNIKFHHSDDTMNAIKNKGLKVLYTPPYSPRFNAIEYIFSALKRQYRTQCSFLESNDPEDFVSLFDCVVHCMGSCQVYFDHVYRSVVELITNKGIGMSGYD